MSGGEVDENAGVARNDSEEGLWWFLYIELDSLPRRPLVGGVREVCHGLLFRSARGGIWRRPALALSPSTVC
jgi:hypothetical protein